MYYPIAGCAKRIKNCRAAQIRRENGEKTDRYPFVKQIVTKGVQM